MFYKWRLNILPLLFYCSKGNNSKQKVLYCKLKLNRYKSEFDAFRNNFHLNKLSKKYIYTSFYIFSVYIFNFLGRKRSTF